MALFLRKNSRKFYAVLSILFFVVIGVYIAQHSYPAYAAVPNTPSITAPTGGATGQHPTNLLLSSSVYSGSPAHSTTDWRITKTPGDCATGTDTVWESLDNATNLVNIPVNSTTGDFKGDQNGKNGLKYNTTYYSCVRHTNVDGDSSWSSEANFTTEDLANWNQSTDITINNTGGALSQYQVHVQLGIGDIDFSLADSAGADIRFSDSTDTYALPYFIADYDQAGETASLWVRVDSIAGSGNTTITLYYDNNSVTAQSDSLAGASTFVDFTDESTISRWTNGFFASALSTFTATGDYIYLVDNHNTQTQDAGFIFNADAQALSGLAVEMRGYAVDGDAGTDSPLINVGDGILNNRYSALWAPWGGTNGDAWGSFDNSVGTAIGDGFFVYGDVYEYSFQIEETTPVVDYYIYSTTRSLIASDIGNGAGVGTPTDADYFHTGAYGGTNRRMYQYIDFVAVRSHSTTEPTIASIDPNVSVPATPTNSTPANNATAIDPIYATFTSSAFSGVSHTSSDWRIVNAAGTCSTGTGIVWESLDDTKNLTSINLQDGTFASEQLNKRGLRYGSTYKWCVRHTNPGGDSGWSAQTSFSTEDIANNWIGSSNIVINNTNGALTNMPVAVAFGTGDIDFSSTEPDGSDLRFSDSLGQNALPYFISNYDPAGESAVVWVLVDSLAGSGNTTIQVHYNNPSVPSPQTEYTQGSAVFTQFTNEADLASWINGWGISAFNTFAAEGDYVHVVDNDNTQRDAALPLNNAAVALGSYAMEYRMYQNDGASNNDAFSVNFTDTTSGVRFSELRMPHPTDQDAWAVLDGGATVKFGDTLFAFGTTYEYSQHVVESPADMDYYVRDSGRTTVIASSENNGIANNSPTDSTHIQLLTNSSANYRADAYIDYIAVRQKPASDPTVTSITVNGSAPSAPSITSPTASATGVSYNPILSSGAFSGDIGHYSTDWKIVKTNNCTSGTVLWSASDDKVNKTVIVVNHTNGTFANDLVNQGALDYSTTYYACVRHTNLAGDSAWSSPVAFTSEAFAGSNKQRLVTLTTTQPAINTSQVYLRFTSVNWPTTGQADGDDWYFTDSTQTHAYPYWFETFDNVGKTADVYVLVDSLPNADTTTLYLITGDATATAHSSCANTMEECIDFEDNNVSDWINVDLTTLETTNTDQFSGAYGFHASRASGTGGGGGGEGVAGDAQYVFKHGPYTAGTHAFEWMTKMGATSGIGLISPYNNTTDLSNGLSGIFFNSASNIHYYISGGSNDSGANYVGNTWYKNVNYPLNTTQYDAQLFVGGNKTAAAHYDSGVRSMQSGMTSTDIRGVNVQRVDSGSDLYFDNFIVRRTAAVDSASEPTFVIGAEQSFGAPLITTPASVTQATNASGEITFTTTVQDLQGDESRLKVEFSKDGGSTWLDPWLVSCAASAGSTTVNNGDTYQCGTTDGIDTDTEGTVTVTVVWDTDNVGNEGGAITDRQTDIQLRITSSDGTNVSNPKTTANFEVDNAAPTALASFAIDDMKLGAAEVSWLPASDDNFDHYEIWFDTTQADAQNRNNGAVEWDNSDDPRLADASTTSTTVLGLGNNTTYYLKIWAVDAFGNEQTVIEASGTTENIAAWSAFQEVTVDNTGNLSYSYLQVDFEVPKADLPGIAADCSDVRMLDFDQASQLDYWIEDCDTNIRVWVEIPHIANNTVDQIFIYYGNNAASSESNGKATFLEFIDEADINAFVNGPNQTTFSTIEAVDGFLHFAEASGQNNDASFALNPAVEATQDFAMELEMKNANQPGDEDVAFVTVVENTYDDRYSQTSQPWRGLQNGWGYRDASSHVGFGSTFAFDTIYRHVHQVRRSVLEVDYFVEDTARNLQASAVAQPYAVGSPASADLFYVINSGLDYMDAYIDWVFFRKYVTSAPVLTIGNAPDAPTLNTPADAAENVAINPTLGIIYNGGGTPVQTEWQVSDDNTFSADCSDANIVWCDQTDAVNLSSVEVNTTNGTFQNARNGFTTLDSNTTYYWRARTKNAGGWSNWSTSRSFTTVAGSPPTVSNVVFEGGSGSLNLIADGAKSVAVTATLTDTDGCSEITGADLKLYRTDLGAAGGDDDNFRKTSSCTIDVGSCTGGADTTATVTCNSNLQYYADPTDPTSVNAATNWTAAVTGIDAAPGTPTGVTFEVNSLAALRTSNTLNFGTLNLGQDTGATNQDATVTNTGNQNIDITVHGYGNTPGDGNGMICASGAIPVNRIKYKAFTGFTYGTGGTQLSSLATEVDADIPQRTTGETSMLMKFGLQIPASGVGASCSGTIVFAAVADPNAD